ncbi:NAD(P)-binding protein [Polyplosphaeria fusca]|uniref:NAD(P)-binding protein n=1 Tax=Polyplosphaeria fusca TaxID=682080 RepID=A0A9P4QYI4_9PLEO|nr:NAD(P)-binding protein [Polyplosphaeria fusca]
MSTKTIAIVGLTGNQGGSVADFFLNKPGYKVRGISRDPSKPSAQEWAQKGVEVVPGTLDDVDSLKAAFSGAQIIFGTTDFWTNFQQPSTHSLAAQQNRTPNEVAHDLEIQQGKTLIDAVAAHTQTVERFVLSTLSDTKKWSKGTITFNLHFDAKPPTKYYLESAFPALASKSSFLQLGSFASNWKTYGQGPRKQDDGTFCMEQPMRGDRKVPMVDVNADTGRFVDALVRAPAGTHMVGAGSVMSWDEFVGLWGARNGVVAAYRQVGREGMEEGMGSVGREMADMLEYIERFGYDGGDPSVVYPWDLGVGVEWTTMEEYIEKTDFSSVVGGEGVGK